MVNVWSTTPTQCIIKSKVSAYSIAERRVPELIPVLGSQSVSKVSHKPGGRLPLLFARPAVSLATLKRAATNFAAWWTEAWWVWTVCPRLLGYPTASRLRYEPRPSAPESSTLTTRLPSQPPSVLWCHFRSDLSRGVAGLGVGGSG